jgi:hypothetical protein
MAQLSGHSRRPVPHRHPDRALRPAAAVFVVVGSNHSATSCGPRSRRVRNDRHCTVGQHQSGRTFRLSSRCTARRRTSPARHRESIGQICRAR